MKFANMLADRPNFIKIVKADRGKTAHDSSLAESVFTGPSRAQAHWQKSPISGYGQIDGVPHFPQPSTFPSGNS